MSPGLDAGPHGPAAERGASVEPRVCGCLEVTEDGRLVRPPGRPLVAEDFYEADMERYWFLHGRRFLEAA